MILNCGSKEFQTVFCAGISDYNIIPTRSNSESHETKQQNNKTTALLRCQKLTSRRELTSQS